MVAWELASAAESLPYIVSSRRFVDSRVESQEVV